MLVEIRIELSSRVWKRWMQVTEKQPSGQKYAIEPVDWIIFWTPDALLYGHDSKLVLRIQNVTVR